MRHILSEILEGSEVSDLCGYDTAACNTMHPFDDKQRKQQKHAGRMVFISICEIKKITVH